LRDFDLCKEASATGSIPENGILLAIDSAFSIVHIGLSRRFNDGW
jgi:hypothetical protein